MSNQFNYPVRLTKQRQGGYLVQFPDLPEAITQGENIEDALNEARDCLEEAIAHRVANKLEVPAPSKINNCKHVTLSATNVAKVK